MTRLTVDDIHGVVAILPTPSLPGADHWAATDTVDLVATEALTDSLVSAGVDVILTNGTFGEGAGLTEDEWATFNETVVAVVGNRVPVFTGVTTLNTRDTIARARRAQSLGADGLFLGRPMWVALDDEQIVTFHRSIAEALPDMSQIAYDNPSAFKGKISTEVYRQLATIPQIVAAKHMGLTLMGDRFIADLEAVAGRIRLLPIAEDWPASAQRFPDAVTACWSGDVSCGPAPALALRNAVLSQDWETAERIASEISDALSTLFPDGSFEEFSKYNIQIDRAEFEAAGYFPGGPTRPPYTTAPEAYLEGGRQAGRRWAALHEKYDTALTASR
ncbi:MAG TPA: dihydrodipicolinate synthase family protein [Pseudolysinimonas sp.]|nr:dihydrodipicolinate synthase family protein [Pseudolysinimonas sp.]